MNLLEIRGKLDVIDREIVELYQKRMELCGEVARDKIRTGKKVFDPVREAQKLDSVAAMVQTDFDKQAVRELYQQLMTLSRRLQFEILTEYGKTFDTGYHKVDQLKTSGCRVAYQGVEGAFAHLAAVRSFSGDCEFYNVRTWRDAMEEVKGGKADYAVLPIENSSHGAVSDNFDLLLEYPELAIVAETDLKVDHMLMAGEGASLNSLRKVYSHPQALGQCSQFFRNHPEIEAVPTINTAVAARLVADSGDRTLGALASEQAAELYGLTILERSVNQEKNNTTRFLIVGAEKVFQKDAHKISLCFETAHQPGALYNVLGNFIFNNVNMIMIQSRPIPEKTFEYRFFADIEGRLDDANIINALNGVEDQITELRILGCY